MDENIKMMRLGLDDEERQRYFGNEVSFNKWISRLNAKARQNAKRDSCYVCKKPCTSFCNSHSVPQFCLRRIAVDGKVYISDIQRVMPLLGKIVELKRQVLFI